MDSLGLEYRFLAQFLRGKLSKVEMIQLLEIAIRQFSKRQMMWFKRNGNIKWFHPKDTKKVMSIVKKFLN